MKITEKHFKSYKLKNFKKGLFLIFLFSLVYQKGNSQGMILTQCAINMVKGMDSLVKGLSNSSCNYVIVQHRTILPPACSLQGGACGPTDVRFVFTSMNKFEPDVIRMFWAIAAGPPAHFPYWGLCTPPPPYFIPGPNSFPSCAPTAENNVDYIRIKKIVGVTQVDENVLNIKSILNPRLMTPLDPFWSLVTQPQFILLHNSLGVLVDITLKDNTTYVGMIWHKYTPAGAGGSFILQWKDNIPCPTLSNITTAALASPGACSKILFNTTISNIGVLGCPNLYWNYGDGTALSVVPAICVATSTVYIYSSPGTYTPTAMILGPGSCLTIKSAVITVTCAPPCIDCIPSFAPSPNKKYVLSAWVKEKNPAQSITTYVKPEISVTYTPAGVSGPYTASGDIIDGWQRVEAEFSIPALATDLDIKLNCVSGDCYFDDIRVFPVDGSMKSYVYDPVTMRLVAELDERNYATLYEYDEEGKLIRVKKETEKGKMTIQENRNNTKK